MPLHREYSEQLIGRQLICAWGMGPLRDHAWPVGMRLFSSPSRADAAIELGGAVVFALMHGLHVGGYTARNPFAFWWPKMTKTGRIIH